MNIQEIIVYENMQKDNAALKEANKIMRDALKKYVGVGLWNDPHPELYVTADFAKEALEAVDKLNGGK